MEICGRLFCEMAKQKRPNSIRISKVNGHATDKNAKDVVVTWKDKWGNDRADKAAMNGSKIILKNCAK